MTQTKRSKIYTPLKVLIIQEMIIYNKILIWIINHTDQFVMMQYEDDRVGVSRWNKQNCMKRIKVQ